MLAKMGLFGMGRLIIPAKELIGGTTLSASEEPDGLSA
jgi:hypothetical protein